jgi:hypothetical protein
MRESWAFIGIKGKTSMSEMRRNRKTRVQAGRTWIIRTRTVRKTVIRRVKRVAVRRRTSVKTGRRIMMRGGRVTSGGVRHSVKIQSAGFEAGNYARIYHNGRKMKISRAGRGLNIFAWTSSW